MHSLVVLFIRTLETMFAIGMSGSAIVLVLTMVEDLVTMSGG